MFALLKIPNEVVPSGCRLALSIEIRDRAEGIGVGPCPLLERPWLSSRNLLYVGTTLES